MNYLLYIDPGSGSYLLQAIIAAVLGAGFWIKMSWHRIKAFFGGTKGCMLNMFQFISNQIDIDYSRGLIAKWHDESHSNKFFIL